MKAVVFNTKTNAFEARELPAPTPGLRDLLVRVDAVSLNPVDTKRRRSAGARDQDFEILGWDAAGTVTAVGAEVTAFKKGDQIFYAGDISRQGSNAELQLVDERIAAIAPRGVPPAAAAALPLTALTAYEALFSRLGIAPFASPHTGAPETLLVIGGAGGVGSIAIQLAKLAGIKVVATASRAASRTWCLEIGADAVIDHTDLVANARAAGFAEFDYIFNTQDTTGYWDATADLIRPEGKICSIVEAKTPVDLTKLMGKSATFSWELMFTRPLFRRPEMERQGQALRHVAGLLERGALKSTLSEVLGSLSASSLTAAHEALESRRTIGKLVLSGIV